MRREWIEIEISGMSEVNAIVRLPPCGGSGLKCILVWGYVGRDAVSLHAEGVD